MSKIRCNLLTFDGYKSEVLFGSLGVYIYIASFALPLKVDLPLFTLSLCTVIALLLMQDSRLLASHSSLTIAIIGFLFASAISIFSSIEVGKSLSLGIALLPALLLFFLISNYFRTPSQIKILYGLLSCMSVMLSLVLLSQWCAHPDIHPSIRVKELGSPLLVVPNDIVLLSILAPLAFIVWQENPKNLYGVVALVSIPLSIVTIISLQSRTALLTLLLTIFSTLLLLKRKQWLKNWLASCVLIIACIDGALGFPMGHKFMHLFDTRILVWITAWHMFMDAPFFGHGPHVFGLLYPEYLNHIEHMDLLIDERNMPWPHNLYLELLAERGAAGLLSFGMILVFAIAILRKRLCHNASLHGYAAGVLASFIGILFSAVFELSFIRLWFVVILFVLLGVVNSLSSMTTSQH